MRHADRESGDDRDVPEDRRERRDREVVVAVQDPDTIPETPSSATIGKSTRDSPTASASVVAGLPKRPITHGATSTNSAVRRRQPEQHQPEEARGNPPRTLAVALFEQVAEDRDERGGERRVGDERPNKVRHLERNRERVDPARQHRSSTRPRSPARARAHATRRSRSPKIAVETSSRPRLGRPSPPPERATSTGQSAVGDQPSSGVPARAFPWRRRRSFRAWSRASRSPRRASSSTAHAAYGEALLAFSRPPLPVCGHFFTCPTSSSRRSASAPPPKSGSRTCATARRSRR